MLRLPIDEILPEIVSGLHTSGIGVLRAPPGAGKTTGVPLALLRHADDVEAAGDRDSSDKPALPILRRMIVLQPRRIAAMSAADRIADLVGTNVGQRVGYQIRFDKRWDDSTNCIAMTTGVLLRRLQSDPFLENIDAVLLDEFHERSLEMDLALGMLTRIVQTVRPDLRLLVMSATLQAQPIVDYLTQKLNRQVLAFDSQGRAYPVRTQYVGRIDRASSGGSHRHGKNSRSPQARRLQALAEDIPGIVDRALDQTDGGVLVFLPGVGEIQRVAEALRGLQRKHGFGIHLLHGSLSAKDQAAVLRHSKRRKVVLATNVAETSVTIPEITAVIDSGLARVMRYQPGVGLSRLEVEPISMASADQRAGRAGRTAPGVCFRMWPEAMNRGRDAYDTPEVRRSDLSAAVLQLAGWDETDVAAFPWLDPPAESAIQTAVHSLQLQGALQTSTSESSAAENEDPPIRSEGVATNCVHGGITEIGRLMLRIPAHPRIARMLVAAAR
ncbi:MAG: helicase-related protein, partial [Planctomycetota bacterium]